MRFSNEFFKGDSPLISGAFFRVAVLLILIVAKKKAKFLHVQQIWSFAEKVQV